MTEALAPTPFLNRLEIIRRPQLRPSLRLPETSPRFVPQIVLMDTPRGIAALGDCVARGQIAVIGLGPSYGIIFRNEARQAVAIARRETQNPLPTVSLLADHADLESWIDHDLLHPTVSRLIKNKALKIFQGIGFVRFPANAQGRLQGAHSLHPNGEIQVFSLADNSPLINYLKSTHHLDSIQVRSSNLEGELEKSTSATAFKLAQQIGASVFAIRSSVLAQSELHLARRGSVPIIRIPPHLPVIELKRTGNTHPESLLLLLRRFSAFGIKLSISGADLDTRRTLYRHPSHLDHSPNLIRQDLLRKSGLQ